jgi:serine/threonine protein kinase
LETPVRLQQPNCQFEEDLESLASISSWSSKPSSYESWVPFAIPNIPDELSIVEWTVIGEGSHGQVRKIRTQTNGDLTTLCLKLFNQEWKDAYERELGAYTLLIHRGVRRCIPNVYYSCEWPRWKWDGAQPDDYSYVDRDETLYGLVMEYFEDCEEIDLKRVDLHTIEMLGKTLDLIQEAGVIHRDYEERNILLVREAGKVRIVWIDFSCAWSGKIFQGPDAIERDLFRCFLSDNMVYFHKI